MARKVTAKTQAKWQRQDAARRAAKEKKERRSQLRANIKAIRAQIRVDYRTLREVCKVDRLALRERIKGRNAAARAALQELADRDRENLRADCRRRKELIRSSGMTAMQKARALLAEDVATEKIARLNAKHHTERIAGHVRSTAAERRQEADDAALHDIDPSLHGLYRHVRPKLKSSDKLSLAEAFHHYVHETPSDVMAYLNDRAEKLAKAEIKRHNEEEKRIYLEEKARLRSSAASRTRDMGFAPTDFRLVPSARTLEAPRAVKLTRAEREAQLSMLDPAPF